MSALKKLNNDRYPNVCLVTISEFNGNDILKLIFRAKLLDNVVLIK